MKSRTYLEEELAKKEENCELKCREMSE